jgi:uncharacterized membrane protein YcaP (DUF421 family)
VFSLQNLGTLFELLNFKSILQLIIASSILYTLGFFIISFGGKKSIGEITMPHFILAITIGSILSQPLGVNTTIFGTLICVAVLIMLTVFFDWLIAREAKKEKPTKDEPILLIKDGRLQVDSLKEAKITLARLESLLRQKGIVGINYVKTCTLETNGEIGYELKKDNQPLTYDDLWKILSYQPMEKDD